MRSWIEASRRESYTLVHGLVPGTSGIDLPALGPAGDPVAALSLAAIPSRLEPPRLLEVLRLTRAATADTEGKMRAILQTNAAE